MKSKTLSNLSTQNTPSITIIGNKKKDKNLNNGGSLISLFRLRNRLMVGNENKNTTNGTIIINK